MTHDNAAKLVKLATACSVGLAFAMILGKLVAWVMSDSLSVLTSLVDSFFDMVTSIVNALAVRYAMVPADDNHRFGHGKAEDVAALMQSAFIIGSAVFVLVESIHRIVHPVELKAEGVAIGVMLVATVLTTALVVFQKFVARKTGSKVVEVDALHYVTDIIVNGLVIISLVSSLMGVPPYLDIMVAMAIVIYIASSAFKIGKRAFDNLMDHEFPEEQRKEILEQILSHPEIKGVHDLRTRRSGMDAFIQFHLELDGDLPLQRAHTIGDEVEAIVQKLYPEAEILIHHDPEPENELPLELEQVKSI